MSKKLKKSLIIGSLLASGLILSGVQSSVNADSVTRNDTLIQRNKESITVSNIKNITTNQPGLYVTKLTASYDIDKASSEVGKINNWIARAPMKVKVEFNEPLERGTYVEIPFDLKAKITKKNGKSYEEENKGIHGNYTITSPGLDFSYGFSQGLRTLEIKALSDKKQSTFDVYMWDGAHIEYNATKYTQWLNPGSDPKNPTPQEILNSTYQTDDKFEVRVVIGGGKETTNNTITETFTNKKVFKNIGFDPNVATNKEVPGKIPGNTPDKPALHGYNAPAINNAAQYANVALAPKKIGEINDVLNEGHIHYTLQMGEGGTSFTDKNGKINIDPNKLPFNDQPDPTKLNFIFGVQFWTTPLFTVDGKSDNQVGIIAWSNDTEVNRPSLYKVIKNIKIDHSKNIIEFDFSLKKADWKAWATEFLKRDDATGATAYFLRLVEQGKAVPRGGVLMNYVQNGVLDPYIPSTDKITQQIYDGKGKQTSNTTMYRLNVPSFMGDSWTHAKIVQTQYVDESGKVIDQGLNDQKMYTLGQTWSTSSKDIHGYTLDKSKLPKVSSGKISNTDIGSSKPIIVKYVYSRNNTGETKPVKTVHDLKNQNIDLNDPKHVSYNGLNHGEKMRYAVRYDTSQLKDFLPTPEQKSAGVTLSDTPDNAIRLDKNTIKLYFIDANNKKTEVNKDFYKMTNNGNTINVKFTSKTDTPNPTGDNGIDALLDATPEDISLEYDAFNYSPDANTGDKTNTAKSDVFANKLNSNTTKVKLKAFERKPDPTPGGEYVGLSVPNFNFGTHQIKSVKDTKKVLHPYASNDDGKTKTVQYVKIFDTNEKAPAYDVSLSYSPFTNEKKQTLNNAQLTLKGGKIDAKGSMTDLEDYVISPNTSTKIINVNKARAYGINTFYFGDSTGKDLIDQTSYKFGEDKHNATNKSKKLTPNVSLSYPSDKEIQGKFNSKLTWTVTNAPK